MTVDPNAVASVFLSTLSARRATLRRAADQQRGREISIHALREEGDSSSTAFSDIPPSISIHALREEGDSTGTWGTV